jgi:hypothetical protein
MSLNVDRPVTIYISAAPDLMAEREALARMIAELPVTLAWHIIQTPQPAEPLNLEALRTVDLFFLIMGADIRAPVGLELNAARQANRPITGFIKRDISPTPAGQVFTHQAEIIWHSFTNIAGLSQQIRQIIVEYLLDQALYYSLTPLEVAQLEQLLKTTPSAQPAEAAGAGHSAVLLSPERYIPGEGIIVGDA